MPANATLDTLLRDNLTRADLIPGLVSLASSVFDLRRLRTDQPYRLVRTLDGELRRFEYEIDLDEFLRIAPRDDRVGIELTAEVVPFDKTHTMAAVRGAISRDAPSLFEAMELAGEQAELSIALAEVFAGDIDFNVDLQPGDQFAAVVDRMTREGAWAGYGPIVVAEFVNAGRRLRAVRFTPPGGKPGYYDENGRSLEAVPAGLAAQVHPPREFAVFPIGASTPFCASTGPISASITQRATARRSSQQPVAW